MGTDEILQQIRDSLRRLERDISAAGQSPSGRAPRPTEQFPKVELEIMRKIQEHRTTCSSSMKEALAEKAGALLANIRETDAKVEEIRRELGGRINGVRDEATKTATGTVVSLTDKVDKVNEVVFGSRGDAGLEDSVRDLEQWVERYEEEKAKAAASSKFRLSTLLQILGILVAIALGIVGIVLR
jgi:hypothetical protein